MKRWGFTYKTNLIWYKVRKDGGPDRRGVGFYFRNVTELILFGVRGRLRTAQMGRTQPNIVSTQKRGHSRKPDELYPIIEGCSPGPYLEMFARYKRPNWDQWGNEIEHNGSHLRYYPQYAGGGGSENELEKQRAVARLFSDSKILPLYARKSG